MKVFPKEFSKKVLYPFVMKIMSSEYPLDHPTVITFDFHKDLRKYKGILRGVFSAPDFIEYPIL